MIRVITTAVVLALAAVAAIVSYKHILEVVTGHGETGWVAYLVPLCIDGLLVAASLVLLDSARRGLGRHWLSWVALGVGIVLTLGANVLHGLQYGVIGAITSALPSITLTISFELLMGMIRRGAVPAKNLQSPKVPEVDETNLPVNHREVDPVAPSTPEPISAVVELATVPAVLPSLPALMPVLTPAPDELFPVAANRYADQLAEGQAPSVTRLKRDLKIGQPRAAKVKAYLDQLAEARPGPVVRGQDAAEEITPVLAVPSRKITEEEEARNALAFATEFTRENPPTEADLDADGLTETQRFIVRRAWNMPDPEQPAEDAEQVDHALKNAILSTALDGRHTIPVPAEQSAEFDAYAYFAEGPHGPARTVNGHTPA